MRSLAWIEAGCTEDGRRCWWTDVAVVVGEPDCRTVVEVVDS